MEYFYKLRYLLYKGIKKDKKILCISVIAGLLITFFISFSTFIYSEKIQGGISKSIIRLHVIANSDTEDDQNLKIAVRDTIIENIGRYLSECKDIKQSRNLIYSNMDNILKIAKDEVVRQGYNYEVNVFLSKEVFPMKKYRNNIFPAGVYEALRVEIGNAKGKNWWCVMYPPMCFIDFQEGEFNEESQTQLKTLLSDEEYDVISNDKETPKLKFKIVEFWQEIKNNNDEYITKGDS